MRDKFNKALIFVLLAFILPFASLLASLINPAIFILAAIITAVTAIILFIIAISYLISGIADIAKERRMQEKCTKTLETCLQKFNALKEKCIKEKKDRPEHTEIMDEILEKFMLQYETLKAKHKKAYEKNPTEGHDKILKDINQLTDYIELCNLDSAVQKYNEKITALKKKCEEELNKCTTKLNALEKKCIKEKEKGQNEGHGEIIDSSIKDLKTQYEKLYEKHLTNHIENHPAIRLAILTDIASLTDKIEKFDIKNEIDKYMKSFQQLAKEATGQKKQSNGDISL